MVVKREYLAGFRIDVMMLKDTCATKSQRMDCWQAILQVFETFKRRGFILFEELAQQFQVLSFCLCGEF